MKNRLPRTQQWGNWNTETNYFAQKKEVKNENEKRISKMAHQLYGENNLRYTETGLKNVSGKYNGVYKGPRALYTKMSESFIYFQTTGKIEVKS